MHTLLAQIKSCNVCLPHLPLGVNPVMSASPKSKVLIIGQAPGRLVHQTGIPWDDQSGDNLRAWLGVDRNKFYNVDTFALMPMGFCYPGTGRSGDLSPRAECAPLWHDKLLALMPEVKLTLLLGQYSQAYYLGEGAGPTLTDTVRHFRIFLPQHFPLPHPSPRNNIWQAKNPWFGQEVLPELRRLVQAATK